MGCFELHPSCAAEDPGNENIKNILFEKYFTFSGGDTERYWEPAIVLKTSNQTL